ncbi:MAG TPA: GGDEF domain-containing protein [Bdellovibrionota bacterium]|nr:GGDEF domain-containing protein [Bdellovibrionota bacterium]
MVCPPIPTKKNNPSDDRGEKTAVLQGDQETLKKELQKAKEQESCLIIIRGTPQGHRFFLTQNEMTIGRDPAADITVADQSISRTHAKLTKEGSQVRLTDLGSSNGTHVNDKKVNPGDSVILEKEDMIRIGSSILKFLPAGELEILFYGNLGSAAHQDPLTKIYNKGYLLEALDAEFKRAKALHTDFSVLFFDLDHFKKVNDTYGHEAGDYVLIEITNLIRTGYLRPKDIFSRYGGEEFVILLARTNAQAAGELAEAIRSAVEAHAFIYEGKRLNVTTSIGVAELRTGIESPQTLLKAADKALYAAKTSGRNRVVAAS